MNLITLDFETYFDSEYTLSKMTTEEYVRDPRFQTHCVGLRWPDGEITCTAGTKLKTYLDWSKTAVLAHHAQFDGLILSHHYGITPAFWLDTLSMARLLYPHDKSHSLGALAKKFNLPEKNVPYDEFKGLRDLPSALMLRLMEGCANDIRLTYDIYISMMQGCPIKTPESKKNTWTPIMRPELTCVKKDIFKNIMGLNEKK
jgi:DNA polymerase III epsilon subunit-like protein